MTKPYTIFEHARGEWEVCNPEGHFIISEWVSKREAQAICNRENRQQGKRNEIKGRLYGLELQLLVANLIPRGKLSVKLVNQVISDIFEYADLEQLRLMVKSEVFLEEVIDLNISANLK